MNDLEKFSAIEMIEREKMFARIIFERDSTITELSKRLISLNGQVTELQKKIAEYEKGNGA